MKNVYGHIILSNVMFSENQASIYYLHNSIWYGMTLFLQSKTWYKYFEILYHDNGIMFFL